MKNITIDQVLELLPKIITLHYVDRSSSLDNDTDIIQKCISEGNIYSLYEKVDEWFIDDTYTFDETVKELKSDMEDAFEIDKHEAENLYNKYEDEIRDAIYNRDDSNTLKDLFRNTSDYVMFYDTGHFVECAFPCNDEEYTEQLAEIKRVIKLDSNDYDDLINMMMYQAGYGGNLVIYFRESGLDVLRNIEDGCNVISFSGEVHIAIPNHGCGAGDHTSFKHKFSLPFDKANLFLCKEVKYSYTYDVCGMVSSWCEGTDMELSVSKEDLGEVVLSDKGEHMAREAKLDKTFRDGGCTAGDMKYERHKNTTYINEYPCGTRCNSCGTFFID